MSLEKNPFLFGQIVEKTSFFDRTEEQSLLHSSFLSGQNTIVIAPRRYGKSSLIHKVLDDLKKRDFFSVYIDLFRASTMRKFNDIVSQAIAEATKTPLKQLGTFLKEWAPKLSPRVIFRGDALPEVEFEFTNSFEKEQGVSNELLNIPHKYANKKNKTGVVVFDEFQEILQFGDIGLLKEIRAIIQNHQKIAYCFSGSKRHLISKIFMDFESPFYQFGKLVSLSRLPRDEFFTFIVNNLKTFAIKDIRRLTMQILDFTDCHPFYTQMFCSYLWDLAKDNKKEGLFKATLETVLRNQSYACSALWDRLTPRQKNFLLALTKSPNTAFHSAEAIMRWDLGSSATVSKVMNVLTKENYIEMIKDKPHIVDPFFEVWIQRL